MQTFTWASNTSPDWTTLGNWSPIDSLISANTLPTNAPSTPGVTTIAAAAALTTTGSVTGTTLNVTLSGSLQAELNNKTGVFAYAVWFDKATTIPQWTTLVNNGTIENAGTDAISLPGSMNGGKVYFIVESQTSSAPNLPGTVVTAQSDLNFGNATTFDFSYDSFEVSLLNQSGDAGNLSSVNGFALPMEVSVLYSNGSTATVGYGISGSQIVNDIGSIIQNGTTVGTAAVYNFTAGSLASPSPGDFRMALSPAGVAGAAPFSSSNWSGYVTSIENGLTGGTLSPIVLSGEFNGAPDAGGVWHNGGYFAYQLEWDSTNTAFKLVPLPSSQIQGTIEITPGSLEANIYAPGGTSTANIYGPNGSPYLSGMNTGANNQWGKVLSDFFTGFTGGFYAESGQSPNPQLAGQAAGTIDLNQNMNWEPIYAFGQNLASPPPTGYQTWDPYSQIFYANSNSYGSAYSDNLMSQYTVGGPLISLNNPGTNTDVSTIDLTIFANGETPSPRTSQGYTPPQIYNYISAATGSYAVPDTTNGENIVLDFAASVANNAGVVLAGTDTMTLSFLTSDVSGVPGWDTITFDGGKTFDVNGTPDTLGLWQNWNITSSSGTYTAVPYSPPVGQPAGSMLINNLPVYSTGTAVSWYEIGVGGKTFNLYATTIGGKFEDPNYIGQQGALAVDGLATITPPLPTEQTLTTFTVNFASSSAITVNPSLLVANTAAATASAWAANNYTLPTAPVVGTLSAGTFSALPNQTMEATNTITTSDHNIAFGWTGENPNATVGATPWVSFYTNKIDGGDVARITIAPASGPSIATTGTADIDGQWNTGTVDLGNGTYTVTMQEYLPTDTAHANPLTPISSALTLTVTCFVAGTRIHTTAGEVPVEELCIGHRVPVLLGAVQPVTWIGHRRVDCARHPQPHSVWPVRVRAGAFGPGQPARDLHLSPDHAVYLMDVLIPVKYLIDGNSVVQEPVNEVTYYHVELPQHSVLLAEGLPVESYLDTGDRSNFANGEEPMRLFPDFATSSLDTASVWEAKGCAPLIIVGPQVDAARLLLAGRAIMNRSQWPEAQTRRMG